ncbi:hypothetical protein C0W42_21510 [Photobacterium kishitanii]|uniref:hypothetical protein n=1 Tax=Photobacterium kishitanii TaxID=318456 RepID=UPI000D15E7A1|nr:hypothetical protein [Photobacterium kishitanii]PSU85243.1 hypothetical protein C0W42_21510 [Photobacterium kishitanii]
MEFLNSSFFTSLITLAVGFIAWFVYFSQQKQTDRDAATLVYLQIREAERRINELQQQPQQELVVSSMTKQIIGENSWEKFKGRLVKYFDADEIDLINNFYIRVIAAESARSECKEIFDESLLEKARQIQAKLIDNIYANIDNKEDIVRKRELLIQYSTQEVFVFEPNAPINKAFKELIHINYVSFTPTGDKLKKLAKLHQ